MTPREATPSSQAGGSAAYGRGTYVACLDCGQKFAYDCMTRRLVDFWGIHDTEALAGVRRRVDEFLSPLQNLARSMGRLKWKVPMGQFVGSVRRMGVLTKDQWAKSRRLIASKLP